MNCNDEYHPVNMSMLNKSIAKQFSTSKLNKKLLKQSTIQISEQITNVYSNDLKNIIRTPEPEVQEVYIIFILNCNLRFRNLYNKLSKKSTTDISSISFSYLAELSLMHNNSFSTLAKGHKTEANDDTNTSQIAIVSRITDTFEFRELIKEIFAPIGKSNEALLDTVLDSFAISNSNKLKKTKAGYYNACSEIYSEKNFYDYCDLYLPYYEFHYDDFLVIFCSIVRFFTGLNIRLELSDKDSYKVIMKIYGSNSVYSKMSELLGYHLQVKPYALHYHTFMNEQQKKEALNHPPHLFTTKAKPINDSYRTISSLINAHKFERALAIDNRHKQLPSNQSPLLPKINNKQSLQFRHLDLNNPLHFPPYYQYNKTREVKYRRYEINDNYHECNIDPEFSGNNSTLNYCLECSKFRNIDKLRLIQNSLEQLFKFNTLSNNNILAQYFYHRNSNSYNYKINTMFLFKENLKLFFNTNMMNLINLIRNYYGEYVSFYFLWVASFCRWMIFPSLIGIISAILKYYDTSLKGEIETFKTHTLNYYDIALIIICGFISLWGTLFLKNWRKREKMFSYIWGMEHFAKNKAVNEAFIPEKDVPFVFGERLPTLSYWQRTYKKIVSIGIHGVFILFRLWIMVRVFELKEVEERSLTQDLIVLGISSIIIRIMSILYDYIAQITTKWENYEKINTEQRSLAIKLIVFEFFNNYSSLFYIAFYKPYSNKRCLYDNCHQELEIHLYIILLINFSFNLWELGHPWLRYKMRLKQIPYKPLKHSIQYQLLCEGYNTVIYEYNERIISFGFVCCFTVSAPFTPILVLLFTYMENFFDLYKLFNLLRVDLIEGSCGIDIHNSILKVMNFIGMLSSVALVLFFNPHLVKTVEYQQVSLLKNNDFIHKIIIFAIVENSILLLGKFASIGKLPEWFKHLDKYKEIYDTKYYNKDRSKLPHITNTGNAKLNCVGHDN